MQQFRDTTAIDTRPELNSVQRLLAALGEWGVAEVQGVSQQTLEQLEDRAMDAYEEVTAVA